MPAQSTRARDVRVSVRVDGVDKVPMALDSGTFNYGVSIDTFHTIGKGTPDIEEIPDAVSLQLETRDKAWVRALIYAVRQRAQGNPDYQDLQISATFATDHKGDGLTRYRMPDCKLSDASSNFSGNEKVTSSFTLNDGDYKPA